MEMTNIRVAMIGLDTSHTVEFVKRMVGAHPSKAQCIHRLTPVACCRFETRFQSVAGLDARTAVLDQLGVPVTESIDVALKDADAIMLEVNDPALHAEYFRVVAGLGKPVFLDKPIAQNMDAANEIFAVAKRRKTRFFSSSALRFAMELCKVKAAMAGALERLHLWGPLGTAAAGSSVVWYGVHTVEMLQAIMGHGAHEVLAVPHNRGFLFHVLYRDGRRAVLEMNKGVWRYGGVLHHADNAGETFFAVNSGDAFYGELLKVVECFFAGKTDGVSLDDMKESMRILDALDRAVITGKRAFVRG